MKANRKVLIRLLIIVTVYSFVLACSNESAAPVLSEAGLRYDEKKNPMITATTMEIGGRIYEDGGSPITEVGACWELNTTQGNIPKQFPTLDSDSNKVSGKIGEKDAAYVEVSISGMTVADTTYIVRIYAINKDGKVGYGYPVIITNNLKAYRWNP